MVHLKFGLQYCQQNLQRSKLLLPHFIQRNLQEQQPQPDRSAFRYHLDKLDAHTLHIFRNLNAKSQLFWFWYFPGALKWELSTLQMHLMTLYLLGTHSMMIVIVKVYRWLLFWPGRRLIQCWLNCLIQVNVCLNCWRISWRVRFWLRNLFHSWPQEERLFFCSLKRKLRQHLLWFTYFNVLKHSWAPFAWATWWLRHGHLEFPQGPFCINPLGRWFITWVFSMRPWILWRWRRACWGWTC